MSQQPIPTERPAVVPLPHPSAAIPALWGQLNGQSRQQMACHWAKLVRKMQQASQEMGRDHVQE